MLYLRPILFCSLLLCIEAASFAQSTGTHYQLTGVLKGLGNGKILLGNKPNGYNNAFKIIYFDSCIAHNDSFYFSGQVKEPAFYSIEVAGQRSWCTFIMDNSSIQIAGNKDSIWKATIHGSKEFDTYLQYYREVEDVPLNDSLSILFKRLDIARISEDSLATKTIEDSVALYNNRLVKMRLEFILKHPSSFISLYKLYQLLPQLNIDTTKKYYARLGTNLQNHSLGEKMKHELFELPATIVVGHSVPAFSLPDTSGKTRSHTEYNGKYILLDFWASWCGPCIEEFPALETLYKRYHSSGFEIIGISLDTQKQYWLNAVKKYQILWPTWSDLLGNDTKPAQLFSIKQIPQKYLIDPTGRLVLKNPSTTELEQYLSNRLP